MRLWRERVLSISRGRRGIFEAERGEGFDDRGGDDDAGEPFVVGGDDIPGRVGG